MHILGGVATGVTSIRIRRCIHCRSRYGYQQSGEGCGDGINDARYCRTCKGAINGALTALPVLFECRYVPIAEHPPCADVTRAQIEEWEATFERERWQATALIAKRVWPGLMDLETGDAQNVREVRATSGEHLGTRFRVSSWRQRPDFLVEVPIEWDVAGQKSLGLWHD